jgi:hypothetical protein
MAPLAKLGTATNAVGKRVTLRLVFTPRTGKRVTTTRTLRVR